MKQRENVLSGNFSVKGSSSITVSNRSTCDRCGKILNIFDSNDYTTSNPEFCVCPPEILPDFLHKPAPEFQGWQCPVCKTVHAPHVDKCNCQSGGAILNLDPSYIR